MTDLEKELPFKNLRLYYNDSQYSYLMIYNHEQHKKYLKETYSIFDDLNETGFGFKILGYNIVFLFLVWWLTIKGAPQVRRVQHRAQKGQLRRPVVLCVDVAAFGIP